AGGLAPHHLSGFNTIPDRPRFQHDSVRLRRRRDLRRHDLRVRHGSPRQVWEGGGMAHINDPAVIERLVRTPATWAVVGLSTNRARPAYRVAAYLQGIGKTIVPVHPKAETVHGATGY